MDDYSSQKSIPHYKINLIENESEVDVMADKILNEAKNPVIGVDCEAALEMSRFGILCLIQVTLKIKSL